MQNRETTGNSRAGAGDASLFALLVVVDSLHFIFARALFPYLPPTVSALFVLLIATGQVGIFGLIRGEIAWRAWRVHLPFFAAIGALVAVSTAINYAAVGYIDPGTASMLGKVGTLYALGFSIFWLHERLNRVQVAGILLAVAGVFVVTFQAGDYLRLGSLMILASTFMYALHAAIVKRYGGQMDFTTFFFYRLFFTTLFLMAIALWQNVLVWPTRNTWALLLLAATIDVTLSRSLYYLALRRLPMSVHAIVLTVSPVLAILWSVVLFDAIPTSRQLLGGIAVLAGVFLTTRTSQRS